MPNKNKALQKAKSNRRDEFYTLIADIENEMMYYKEYFKGRIIYCNCDNYQESAFWKYFYDNFVKLGLKKLIATHIDLDEVAIYDGDEVTSRPIKSGDFRSEDCLNLLEEADTIITNPPFSLFREYVSLLFNKKKDFLIIGHQNGLTYKEIFPYIQAERLRVDATFKRNVAFFSSRYEDIAVDLEHKDGYIRVAGVLWYTNIAEPEELKKKKGFIPLRCSIHSKDYPKYANCNAINIDKTSEIPMDYSGTMGVPVSFINRYNSEQFEIVGFRKGSDNRDLRYTDVEGNIVYPYCRFLIKKKNLT